MTRPDWFHLIPPDAPVEASAEALIEAPADLVWRILSDLGNWPAWNPAVSKMRVEGAIAPGTQFRWKAGGAGIVSKLALVAPPDAIAWTGRTLGIQAVHVWSLEAVPEGTRAETRECFVGWLPRQFPGLLQRTLARALQQSVQALKAEAERRGRA